MRRGIEETICAVSTPRGEGGIGVVRVSGPEAIALVDRFFRGKLALLKAPSHTVQIGTFVDGNGGRLDEVLVTVMRAPRTYTREDLIEIGAHGSPLILARILETLAAGGGRVAEPGEFTKRAFLNGRIDLTQAEAVMELIRAKSDVGVRAALVRLGGGLQEKIEGIRKEVLEVLAHLEAAIDFGDEGIEFIPRARAVDRVTAATEELGRLLSRADCGRILQEGVLAAIIGRPNVGKSSLLNRLLGQDRAIVTPIPGTTRDTLEEFIVIDGIPIRLIDTAGLHASEDPVEREGMRRTEAAIDQAELLLVVLEAGRNPSPQEMEWIGSPRPKVIIENKIDLNPESKTGRNYGANHSVVRISATRGDGIEALRAQITKSLGAVKTGLDEVLVARSRQRVAIDAARQNLRSAVDSLKGGMGEEIVAVDLRSATDRLAEILGLDVTDELLDKIFGDFCIGK